MSNRYDVLIEDCHILTPDMCIDKNKSVAIHQGFIAAIADAEEAAVWQAEERVEAKGKLLMPGLINGHTHTCQQLLRGRVSDEYPMIWSRFLVPFESILTEDDVSLSAKMACLEMIKSGTTAFADSGGRHMHRVADAVLESGMRACIARSTMDMGGTVDSKMIESPDEAISRTEELFHSYHNKGNGRIQIWFALRQVMTCSPELVRAVGIKAREYDTGIHAHLYEHRDEVSFCLTRYKKRPAAFLEDMGALGPHFLAAHNVLMNDQDIDCYARHGVKAVHCPHSNLTSHGFPKTPQLLNRGIAVGLGSDGSSAYSASLFNEIRSLRASVKAFWGLAAFDPVILTCPQMLAMATTGSAAALRQDEWIGRIEVGKKADLITLNIAQPHLGPTHNLINTIAESAGGQDVVDSMINGKWVMRDRKVLTMDEHKVMSQAEDLMNDLAERAGFNH